MHTILQQYTRPTNNYTQDNLKLNEENKIFQGTQKSPRYQPQTESAVLMKHLVESDKERQAEPPVDPTDAFLKSTAATVKTFSPYYQNICKSRTFATVPKVEMTEILQETQIYAFIRIFFWLSR